ncbi:MAG: translation elongation factor Ts [Muribaculaceae bacterium]|nr:translation elongation factor Ts [Muribaculaceae bacterium]
MAVSIEDIKKLRHLTSAGLSDCKNALNETNGDMEAAIEILRKKGQAIAAKREDRTAGEGCVLAKSENGFAAIVALKCETDFVAKNAGFVELTQKLLDLAVANKVESLDALKALVVDGRTVEELVVEESGKTGEKTEIGAYECLAGESVIAYNHLGNKLSTIVAFNQAGVDTQVMKDVAMQVAAMNPIAVDRASVPQSVVESEYNVAVDKSRAEQIQKAVEAAIKKAGINPNLVDSEDHISSNIAKGWLTEEEAQKAREIAKEAAEKKAANMPEQMIQNIANGRVNKFYKESCLMEQEFVKDANITIGQYLEQNSKGLSVVNFKRVNLNED